MKQYFDIYIRPCSGRIPLGDLESVTNILDDWDRLEYPELKASFKLSPQTVELGDGTQGVDGEKVEVESGTFRCDIAEHNYLRGAYHSKLCDVMFYNPQNRQIVALAYGVKVTVSHIVSSGESRVIKLVGSRSLGVGAVETGTVVIMYELKLHDVVLLTGTVYESDGVTPVEGATVSVIVSANAYEDNTDKDGKYLILARGAVDGETLELAAKKGSGLEWTPKQIVIDVNMDNVLDLVADKEE